MTLLQDNCAIKYILFCFCILTALTGLYLSFKREKSNINKGGNDLQDGSANVKEGSVKFKFAIGLILIVIGLTCSFYCMVAFPGCNNNSSDSLKSETETDSQQNFSSSSSTYNGKVEMNNFTTGPFNIDADKGEPIKIKGLHVKKQSVLTLKGDYSFTTTSTDLSEAVIVIYLDNVLTDSVNIDLSITKDLKFEETIPVKKQPSCIQLQLKIQGQSNPEADFIYFKNGLEIGIAPGED